MKTPRGISCDYQRYMGGNALHECDAIFESFGAAEQARARAKTKGWWRRDGHDLCPRHPELQYRRAVTTPFGRAR